MSAAKSFLALATACVFATSAHAQDGDFVILATCEYGGKKYLHNSEVVKDDGSTCVCWYFKWVDCTAPPSPVVKPTILEVTTGGSGCPGNAAQYTIDDETIMAFPDSLKASADATKAVDFSSCDLRVSLSVPAGTKVSVAAVQHAGNLKVSAGSKALLALDAFQAGGSSDRTQTTWAPSNQITNQKFDKESAVGGVVSDCGKDVIVGASTVLQAYQADGNAAEVTVTSVGLKLEYHSC